MTLFITIWVIRNLGNWLPLKTFTNYPQPAPGPIDFISAPVTAGCVRVFGSALSQDDYGCRPLCWQP